MKYAYKNLKGELIKCGKPKDITPNGFRVENKNGVVVIVRKDNLYKKVKHNFER